MRLSGWMSASRRLGRRPGNVRGRMMRSGGALSVAGRRKARCCLSAVDELTCRDDADGARRRARRAVAGIAVPIIWLGGDHGDDRFEGRWPPLTWIFLLGGVSMLAKGHTRDSTAGAPGLVAAGRAMTPRTSSGGLPADRALQRRAARGEALCRWLDPAGARFRSATSSSRLRPMTGRSGADPAAIEQVVADLRSSRHRDGDGPSILQGYSSEEARHSGGAEI